MVVSEISRFARNTRDLLNLVDKLAEDGVQFESQLGDEREMTPCGYVAPHVGRVD